MREFSAGECSIELLFDKRSDGRYYVHSPNVPGLHLAGPDIDALRADVEPAVRDLLKHNRNLLVERIRWVPSLDEVLDRLETQVDQKREVYLVTVDSAA